jgi:hypothetical protein
MLKIDIIKGKDLGDRFNRNKVEDNIETAIKEITIELTKTGKQNAPVKTGFLRNNIFPETKTKLTGEVQSKAPYSIYVHYGHHSYKGNPYFENAIRDSSGAVNNIIKKIGSKII